MARNSHACLSNKHNLPHAFVNDYVNDYGAIITNVFHLTSVQAAISPYLILPTASHRGMEPILPDLDTHREARAQRRAVLWLWVRGAALCRGFEMFSTDKFFLDASLWRMYSASFPTARPFYDWMGRSSIGTVSFIGASLQAKHLFQVRQGVFQAHGMRLKNTLPHFLLRGWDNFAL